MIKPDDNLEDINPMLSLFGSFLASGGSEQTVQIFYVHEFFRRIIEFSEVFDQRGYMVFVIIETGGSLIAYDETRAKYRRDPDGAHLWLYLRFRYSDLQRPLPEFRRLVERLLLDLEPKMSKRMAKDPNWPKVQVAMRLLHGFLSSMKSLTERDLIDRTPEMRRFWLTQQLPGIIATAKASWPSE